MPEINREIQTEPNRLEPAGAPQQEKTAAASTVYIDILRIAACFLVIVNHTNSRVFLSMGPSKTWFVSLTYFFICKLAVPLFLIITGALLLGKCDSPRKSAVRLLRMAAVLVVGSACYYLYGGIAKGQALSVPHFFRSIVGTHITTAYWYLYLYLGVLCLLPILQKLVAVLKKRDLQWLLFLSLFFFGTMPLIRSLLHLDVSSYFTEILFSPHIGILLCGYYLERYVTITRRVFIISCAGFPVLIAVQVIATYFLYQKDPSNYLALDNRVLITVIGSAVCLYVMAKYVFTRVHLHEKVRRAVSAVSRLTLGTYLLSDLMIEISLPVYVSLSGKIHVMAAMVLWELLIFTVCAGAAALLRAVPFLRKWL